MESPSVAGDKAKTSWAMPFNSFAGLFSAAALALTLAGCGSQGDFGRDNSSVPAQRLHLNPYVHTAGLSGIHRGRIPLTPEETELRLYANALGRTYAHQKTHGNYAEFAPIVPRKLVALHKPEVTAAGYVSRINRAGFRSNEARLNAIIDDIRADGRNLNGLWHATSAVYRADTARVAEMESRGTSQDLANDILARIEENRAVIDLALAALAERLAGYDLALADAYLVHPGRGHAGARLELNGLRRNVHNFESNLRGLGSRYALSLPPADGCMVQSLDHNC